ncbi:MAG: tetratricopeptide repeat protein, partial [Acidimicrobiales bacterium]|nr:tetratricopeptide repeat protein [Acidimicrobiales bacterium]
MTVLDPRKDHPGTKAQAVGNVPDLGKCTESQLRAIVDEQAALLRSNASTEAVDILVASEEIAEARAWPAVAATARYLRARVVLEDGRVDEALGLIDAAAIGFREAGESLSAVRTGLGAMHALDDLGRHAEAAAAGESMLAGLAALGPGPDTDWLEAATLGNLGVAYGFTGRHEDALAAQETSAAIWDRLDLPHERALAEANQAIELHSLGRARQACLLFDRALRGFEAADDRLWIAKCHTHRAEALLQLGEFHPALEDVEAAREALRELGATTEQSRLTIIAARARAGLDQPQLAIETLALAIDDPETLPRERATAELLLGLAERQTGRTGVDALRSAHQRFSDLGDDSSRLTAAIALADARGDIESLRSAHHEARSLGRPVHIVSSAVALADHGDSSGLAAAAPVAIDLQLPVLVAAVAMREGGRALDEGAC